MIKDTSSINIVIICDRMYCEFNIEILVNLFNKIKCNSHQ